MTRMFDARAGASVASAIQRVITMFEHIHDDTLIDEQQVRAMIGNPSRSELYKRRKAGQFPPPLPHGGRSARWHTGTVRAWIRAQVAAAAQGVPA